MTIVRCVLVVRLLRAVLTDHRTIAFQVDTATLTSRKLRYPTGRDLSQALSGDPNLLRRPSWRAYFPIGERAIDPSSRSATQPRRQYEATIRQTRALSKNDGQDDPLPHARPHLTHADSGA